MGNEKTAPESRGLIPGESHAGKGRRGIPRGGELSTKARLLQRLRREAGSAVSGETLGEALGISRVAVWKALKSLRDAGYPVTADEGGYRLNPGGGDDFLYPWEFGDRENLFYHWEITGSTMDRARDLAVRGSPGGTVITAGTQTAGRGRNGRSWASSRGGLFFTLLERPNLAVADYAQPALAVHIGLGAAIGAACGKEARLRWPNDVYVRDRKIAGILTELYGTGDRISWMTLGVGVNVNNPVPPRGAVSCAALTGHPLSRRELLLGILDALAAVKKAGPGPGELSRRWNAAADGIGRTVAADGPGRGPEAGGRIRGVFMGVDGSGRGMVQTGEGLRFLSPGSASLRFVCIP
ncbi:MAG: biotin--[acetyl-CoA-carboxylase] ligase [Spirochaetaceae bacterium]|jgi:BirA family biotin operon repressor/biotin-[acetyl-CoA-carboxylase] ligase|nr:biotin--[acetyl-CoA-carboxylase] ligase [Spirochaetaceae bacterium]